LKNWWWLTFFGPPCVYSCLQLYSVVHFVVNRDQHYIERSQAYIDKA